MRAEVALLGGVRVWIDVERVIRTSLHARLAADAPPAVEVHDAVIEPEQRRHRTDRDARCVLAVIAAKNGEEAPGVGVLAFFDLLHPRSKGTEGNVVFRLARDSARVAADAFSVVDCESEVPAIIDGRELMKSLVL